MTVIRSRLIFGFTLVMQTILSPESHAYRNQRRRAAWRRQYCAPPPISQPGTVNTDELHDSLHNAEYFENKKKQ